MRRAKFNTRSNSTLLDHCNLPALFNSHETPIAPAAEILKKRTSIGAAQLKKSKLSINFDNPLLDKTQPSEEDEEEDDDDQDVVTPNVSQKKKRKRVRKRKPKMNGSQSTPKVENGNMGYAAVNGIGTKRKLEKTAVEKEKTNKHTK